MPGTTQAVDLGGQYLSYDRDEWAARPVAGVTFLPGMVLQAAAGDKQIYPDYNTVQLPTPGTLQSKLRGVIAETWPGFAGSLVPAVFLSPSNLSAIRGTLGIDFVKRGFHPSVLIDQSGTGAVTLTDGLGLVAVGAGGQAGYGQGIGIAAATPLTCYAIAALPSAGIGSSITAAALAQASQTDTIAGTPTVGDVYTVTIQSSYVFNSTAAQTTTWTAPPLTAAQAVSVTTAALALLTYLNLQPTFNQYFIATQAAGVVTITVNALGTLFRAYYGPGIQGAVTGPFFDIAISGMVANSLTFAVGVTGVSTATAGGATLAGGTGYKGPIPAYIKCDMG